MIAQQRQLALGSEQEPIDLGPPIREVDSQLVYAVGDRVPPELAPGPLAGGAVLQDARAQGIPIDRGTIARSRAGPARLARSAAAVE